MSELDLEAILQRVEAAKAAGRGDSYEAYTEALRKSAHDAPALLAEVLRLQAIVSSVRSVTDQWEQQETYACADPGECIRCLAYQGATIRMRAALGESS